MKKLWVGILVMTVVFGVLLISCETEPDEPTYTVWTDSTSYTQFYNSFGTLDDGYYFRYEFTSSEWNQIAPSLTNEEKNNWTEDQIKKWFIGRGFGNTEASKETAWFMTINHGFIASRSRSIVYMILK